MKPTTEAFNVGIFGTFDVENYGDLLFPLIAEKELTKRLDNQVVIHPFSYGNKSESEWPFKVNSLSLLPENIHHLDTLLIGGGQIIRFDKYVAHNYLPPEGIPYSLGYWLVPILMAQKQIPVAWNAPGACGYVPAYFEGLVKMAIHNSAYITVRDEWAKEILEGFSHDPSKIQIMPDTAFNISKLYPFTTHSKEFLQLRDSLSLNKPYILIQPTSKIEQFSHMLREDPSFFNEFDVISIPICPIQHESNDHVFSDLPQIKKLNVWPKPLLIAELIANAKATVGTSFHLAVTSISYNVPHFRLISNDYKYLPLNDFKSVYLFKKNPSTTWFKECLGKHLIDVNDLQSLHQQLENHWDSIANLIKHNPIKNKENTPADIGLFWQTLPILLESLDNMKNDRSINALKNLRDKIAKFPLLNRIIRKTMRMMRKPTHHPILNLSKLSNTQLQNKPYKWAMVDRMFLYEYISEIVDAYPLKYFKTVKGYDGEKGYEYEVYSLIHMGAKKVTHPDSLSNAWLRFAQDLLSTDYRKAVSKLIGIDVTNAPMEANLFHFGPGAWLGPHQDLKDKIVTHVFYFNENWEEADGGCLRILGAKNMEDIVAKIPPNIGNSSILVRSENSWHAVEKVAENSSISRRSVTVTFYHPNSISTMWPPNDKPNLHDYPPSPG